MILYQMEYCIRNAFHKFMAPALKKDAGIDGILVTVGLCIIALLLCVVMKDSLKTFIEGIVDSLSTEANRILTGVGGTT